MGSIFLPTKKRGGARSVGFGEGKNQAMAAMGFFLPRFPNTLGLEVCVSPSRTNLGICFRTFRDILNHLLGAPGLPPATVQVQLASNLCKKILWF